MKLIAARPQSSNECTPEFNTLLESAVKSNPRVRLLSMAFDGVSSEADYVRDMLVDFLNGRGDTVSVVDLNHVAKPVGSQLIFGSNIVLAGDYLVDPGLLPAANVSKELYQVTDYTSDLLVIRLCSPLTLQLLDGVAECQNQVSLVVNPDLLHLVYDAVVYVTHWYPLDDSEKLGDLGNWYGVSDNSVRRSQEQIDDE
ncbi:hypothetical protein PsorP6_005485 [Peronosclerospora sorghi]|uniref:Uncharacterized protein n=1 Tax=Peronosclerospora sorghi TaxID=230839 RepID=A0ACC0W3B5_9STRA|nr:hypothetical protein PsorP6_005485 [Peronosclerospora sorghi]